LPPHDEFEEKDCGSVFGASTPFVVLPDHPSRTMLARLQQSGTAVIVRAAGSKQKRGKKGTRLKDRVWSVASEGFPHPSVPRLLDQKEYKMATEADIGMLFNTSTTVFTGVGQSFLATQIPSFSSFASVFDQYRIEMIEVWIVPSSGTGAVLGTDPASFVSVIDYDDNSFPASEGALLDYQNAITTTVGNGHYRSFVPHIAVAAYSGTFTSFANEVAPWIDAASSGVAHYGLKIGVSPTLTVVDITLRARFWMSYRNVR